MRYLGLLALLVLGGALTWFLASNRSLLKEFWLFLKTEKVWWLTPILIVLLLVAVVLLLGHSAPFLAPFIYPLF